MPSGSFNFADGNENTRREVLLNKSYEDGNITVQEYEVIFYYYFECMSNEEVAEVMNYSVQSVFRMKKDTINTINNQTKETSYYAEI